MQTSYSNNVHAEYNGKVEANLIGGRSYNVLVTASTGAIYNNDYTRVYMKQVSGNLPVTGQSVEYVSAGSIYLTAVGDNRDLIFPTNFGGNIPYNTTTGVFTLSANKTYLFQAQVRVNAPSASGSYIEYGFVDAVSNALLVNGTQTITSSTTSTAGFGSNPVINFIYTPTSNQTVKLRTTSNTSGTQTVVSGTANITQIGSSAFVNPWTLSGTNTYNTTGNVGIGTSSPAATLDVTGNVNVTGKINLTDPSGNVVVKAAGFVNAGDYVTLGNLKARIPTSGNRSLQLATGSGTYSIYGSGVHVFASNLGSTTIDGSSPRAISTTPAYLNSGNTFGTAGGTDTWNIMDTSNLIGWRITAIISSGYNANFISIERLL
jgi:hypothetical protein